MKIEGPSDTYKYLYKHIIEELFFEVCNSNINYCVKHMVNNDEIHIAIWKKYIEYKDIALSNMKGNRLDRHKLASCICGALIEIKPLEAYNGARIVKNANEIFALTVGLNIIKFYMMYDVLQKEKGSIRDIDEAKKYLRNNFYIKMPDLEDNICDTQEYAKNTVNALYWSHRKCEFTQKECFRYDIWAYSEIFYHLELYNKAGIEEVFRGYSSSL